ncbi:MAG: T9SS type A sorting domain-containing protein, partial [Bacteroidales bacterium]|nr:T9SS type A sorting domain-containing protein [Bacteroidales bacterium]
KAECGVALEGMLHNVRFHNCTIQASNTAMKTEAAVRYDNPVNSTSFLKDVRLVRNSIEGGAYNIFMQNMAGGAATIGSTSVTIDSNIMKEGYSYGLYSESYAHYTSVSANDITSRKGAEEYCGLWFHSYNDIDSINANRIHAEATGAYGIVLSTSINGSRKGTLANSEVTLTGTKFAYGITLTDPYQEWNIFHNSVSVKCDKGNAYALRLYNNSGKLPFNIKNNLLAAEGSVPYPVYVEKAPSPVTNYYVLDYNDYYAQNMTGYFGKAVATLSDWQTTTGQDRHSVSSQPQFSQPAASLALKDYSAFACNRLKEVPADLLGKSRNAITTMGCYSGSLKLEPDLAAVAFVNPDPLPGVACHADFTDLEVTISNTGNIAADFAASPLKVRIGLSGAANLSMDTVIRLGKLDPAQSGKFRLGRLNTATSGVYHIRVTLSDTADHNPANDTLSMSYNACRVSIPYDADCSVMPVELVQACRKGGSLWKVAASGSLQPAFGTKCLVFEGNGSGDRTDAILNSVNIRNSTDPKLTLWYAHHNGQNKGDSLIVKATTDGGASYTILGRLCAAAAAAGWQRYEFPLNQFGNAQCLSIVLESVAGGAGQQLDRILLSARRDLAVQLLLPQPEQLSACNLNNIPVKAVVTNLTASEAALDDSLTVTVSGAGNRRFAQRCQLTLPGNASDTILVTNALDLSAEGTHRFEAVLNSRDDNPDNDTARDAVTISQDIALTAVSGIDTGTLYDISERLQIKATVTNKGTVPVERMLLRMSANGQTLLTDTLNLRLKAGDSVTRQLSQPFVVPSATKEQPTFRFELSALLDCDANTGDNGFGLTGKVNVPDTAGSDTTGVDTTGIRNVKQADWQLGQNIPNPAAGLTLIPFSLPQAGSVTLSVTAANGQLLHRSTLEADAGENRIRLDLSGFAEGIYYYTLEYNGQRQVRKLQITK